MENRKNVYIARNASLFDHLALTTYLRNIIVKLSNKKQYKIVILPLKSSKKYKINKEILIEEVKGNTYSAIGNLKYAYNLYKKLRKNKKIDIIHCIYPISSLSSAVLYKILNNRSVKIIYDIRSPWIEMGDEKKLIPKSLNKFIKKFFYRLEKYLTKHIDGFIFISEGLKDFYEQKLNLKNYKYRIISSGVDTKFFKNQGKKFLRDKYKLKKDDFIIGYSGTLQKMREMDFLIYAMKELVKKDEKYKLMFIGDGEDRKRLENITNQLKLNNNVIFTGKIPFNDIPKYISGFDIGVCHLPDIFIFRHSSPLKILEYLSCEIPAICSDIETHRNTSNRLKNVFLYKDTKSFNELIEKIKFTPDKNIKRYDWENISEEIIKTWEYF